MQQNVKYVNANGLRFAYYEEGTGSLILLFHGFPDTPHTWSEVQPQLAAAGYRVVAPFMRGYPPTEAPANGDYSAIQLGGDVLALIAALGENRAIVIGHDWGAFAAYAAANLNPKRIRKLVTIGIPHPCALRFNLSLLLKARHFITFQIRKRALALLERNNFAEVEALYRRWSPNWDVSKADLAPVKVSLGAPGGLKAALGYYWSFTRDSFGRESAETRRLLRAKTSVPTLAFFGEMDGALDQSSVDRSRQCFEGIYQLVRTPGVGHFLHREAPRAFLDKTLEFLGQ
jgi:pimeloyl-ACP methyl ester carboxylesterase